MTARNAARWRTRFGRWVSRYGVVRLVEAVRVEIGVPITRHAVYHYVAGRHRPRPDVALAIVRLSGGKVSLADVYQHRTEVGHGEGAVRG